MRSLNPNDPIPGSDASALVAGPEKPAASRRKIWFFRLLMLAIPLVLLLALEIGLRLAGYGYPTEFFLKARMNGRDVLVANDKFAWRFFPPGLARSPKPVVMEAVKPANTYRIFVLGESAALGDPEPAFGFWRYLKVLLEQRFPGTKFEIVCTATTAINSHVILPIARECAGHQGDLWIVYMGNNEMEGPFGAGTALGPATPDWRLVRASAAIKATKTGQWLDELIQQAGRSANGPKAWGGMKMFLEQPIALDSPNRAKVYQHFARNVEDILQASERAKVPVLLATVAVNLRDSAPFGSEHTRSLAEDKKLTWARNQDEAVSLETEGRLAEAVAAYTRAVTIDPARADLQFRLARCQLALTNLGAARQGFERARDQDVIPFRSDSRLEQIVREAAARHASGGTRLVDVAGEVARRSTNGVPGDEWFLEHVHYHPRGNYQLARIFADQVEKLLPEGVSKQPKASWLAEEDCNRRLGLTEWNLFQLYQTMSRRLLEAPFTNQLNAAAMRDRFRTRLAELRPRLSAETVDAAEQIFREALDGHAEDAFLHEEYAVFLELASRLPEAAEHWDRVHELLPHHPLAPFQAGRLLARAGKRPEARARLESSLKLRPDFVEARDELAQSLTAEGKYAEAKAEFATALRQQPDNALLHFHLANTLGASGDRALAAASLQEAVRLNPGLWEARYFLGVELATQDKVAEAQAQFAAVLAARPEHVLANLNLGVCLARQKRFNEALKYFQETLRFEPGNKQAAQYVQMIRQLKEKGL